MLIALLVVLSLLLWVGIVVAYFRGEIGEWLDNRYGPDHKKVKPKRKPFWQIYD